MGPDGLESSNRSRRSSYHPTAKGIVVSFVAVMLSIGMGYCAQPVLTTATPEVSSAASIDTMRVKSFQKKESRSHITLPERQGTYTDLFTLVSTETVTNSTP